MSHPLEIVGRSSSHFTRVTRIFALELGVEHGFRPVFDLTVLDADAYAGNPALKVPILVDEKGPLFGTENICRELVRRSGKTNVTMRGDVHDRTVMNAEEITLHVMASEVALIMAKTAGDDRLATPKVRASIENGLDHLDANVDAMVAALPRDRALSFAEVTLFCLLTHLPFREVMEITKWSRLRAFAETFGERPGAQATPYRFDAPR